MNILSELIQQYFESETLEEKMIKVRHMKPKQRALSKKYRMKNKRKLKMRMKKYRMKVKNKPKAKKGWSYGSDGKLHKKTFRKGVRKHR